MNGSGTQMFARPGARAAQADAVDEGARARARSLYQQALQDIQSRHHARGLMFAKMAVAADPNEPLYQALVAEWAHLDAVPAKKQSEPAWIRLMNQAEQADLKGDTEAAVSLLELALRGKPSEAAIYNALAVVLILRKKEYRRAIDLLIEAVNRAPQVPLYRTNLQRALQYAPMDTTTTPRRAQRP
jgi:tetratricopeptide (TPR) repeat protein